jgi:mRNA-degrading endonuclease HigB of HigAB toxin-antitoxin module
MNYFEITFIDYRRGMVFIKWLGSHEEYDQIDVRTVQYADQTHQD